jgi:hypothetical protein
MAIMRPEMFKGANVLLKAAPSDAEKGTVTDMPIYKGLREIPGGGHIPVIISYWIPEAWERADIQAGKGVFLEVVNPPEFPSPVCLFTQDPFAPPPVKLVLQDDGKGAERENALQNVEVPKVVFDEIFLSLGQASELKGNPNALTDLGLYLAGFIGKQLQQAFLAGQATHSAD